MTYKKLQSNSKSILSFGKALLLFFLLSPALVSFSQTGDSTKVIHHFSGNIQATNNGISLIPSLTLGKPAVMFNFSIGNEKLTFDPQLRFAMEGKPWSFIFWWRYQLVQHEKFQMRLGAHPAFSFKETNVIKDGTAMDIMRVRRYLAGEIAPNFKISKNISISPYYLYAYGVEEDITKNTHYIALQSNFSNLKITDQFYLGINPQVYFLKMDKLTGSYFASTFAISKKNFPVSVSFMMNKTIDSEIVADDFVWSASIVYSFSNKYNKL